MFALSLIYRNLSSLTSVLPFTDNDENTSPEESTHTLEKSFPVTGAAEGGGSDPASSSEFIASSHKASLISSALISHSEGLVESIKSPFSPTKKLFLNAEEVKSIHDRVEFVAYEALARAIVSIELKGDSINKDQSGLLLTEVKRAAHRELFKKDGYISKRGTLLEPSQVRLVIENVGRIIHDRDSKLTFARYSSLTDMLLALDDHNTMVKVILLRSWFGDDSFDDPEHVHLNSIKASVSFYPRVSSVLSFDLEDSLAQRKRFWDTYFPGARIDGTGRSEVFLNILEVRNSLGDTLCRLNKDLKIATLQLQTESCPSRTLVIDNIDAPFASHLSPEEEAYFFNERAYYNHVKSSDLLAPTLLSNRSLSTRELLSSYFPEFFSPCAVP